MAGLVGFIAARAPDPPVFLQRALQVLKHSASFTSETFVAEPRLALGAVSRPEASATFAALANPAIAVAVYGHPVSRSGSAWRVHSAGELVTMVAEGGSSPVLELDGSFLIVVIDRRAGTLEIIGDRTGSLPVVYAATECGVAFAPAAKALFPLLNLRAQLDESAAIAFINCGYPVGDRTQFRGVRMLEPASILTINLDAATVTKRKYWQLRYQPQPRMNEKEAIGRLDDAIREGHAAALADAPRRTQLLLTGGYDSRVVLGSLTRAKQPPDEAITWGVRDDIPFSDPTIARQLAEIAGVPFRFLRYDADTLPRHAEQWTYVSELSSDNLGNFAAGASFLTREAGTADAVFIGDQMLGPGGFPLDAWDAAEVITKVPVEGMLPAWREVVREPLRGAMSENFRNQVQAIISTSPSGDPKDIQDFLYFQLYVFRWLFAATYFREPMVTVRRPLLHRAVMDFTTTLPRWLRVDKRVLVGLLRERMPEFATAPTATAHSLIDWSYASREEPGVREFLREHLRFEKLAATPVGPFIDPDALRQLTADFFAAKSAPVSRAPSRQSKVLGLRRGLSAAPALGRLGRRLEPAVKRLMGWQPGRRVQAVLWRLALLSQLQGMIDAGRFRDAEYDR
jgi:hypothetical protein